MKEPWQQGWYFSVYLSIHAFIFLATITFSPCFSLKIIRSVYGVIRAPSLPAPKLTYREGCCDCCCRLHSWQVVETVVEKCKKVRRYAQLVTTLVIMVRCRLSFYLSLCFSGLPEHIMQTGYRKYLFLLKTNIIICLQYLHMYSDKLCYPFPYF